MSPAGPRVTIIIPNWNGLPHLPDCLAALASQSLSGSRVVMVDNASTDESVAWVQGHHPQVEIMRRADNGGFARAVNMGIAAANSEFVALLNNDTAVDPKWLESLVSALDTNPGYDLAASKMVLFHEPGRLNAAGDVYRLGLLAAKNRGYGRGAARYDRVERVMGACAGAALYRRAIFAEVGLFDEDFFLISEDTDFNLRCLIAGKRCLFVPTAIVRHKVRGTIGQVSTWEMEQLAARNEAIVAGKDLPTSILLLVPLFWPYRLARKTILTRPGRLGHAPGRLRRLPLRVRVELNGFRLGLAKRPDVWRLKAVGTLEILRWLLKGSGPA